jgi:hypothetical protein
LNFMEYCISCTLNYLLWKEDERKELLHLIEIYFFCLRIRAKCERSSGFIKSRLILGK